MNRPCRARPVFVRRAAIALAIALIASEPALAASPSAFSGPNVLTSFLPLYSITAGIAGDRAHVENWIAPGVDPHDFQYRPRDLHRLSAARLLVVAGLGLEGWNLDRLREMSDNHDLRIVEAAAGLPKDLLLYAGSEFPSEPAAGPGVPGTKPNPHFWLDPLLLARSVTNVMHALIAIDPGGGPEYTRNAAACVDRLNRLDRELASGLAPFRAYPFITYHDAFPYFARRYGLRLVGVVEAAAEEQPSARRLIDLTRVVHRDQVRVLFTGVNPPRMARQLAADLHLRVAILETLEVGPLEAGAYEAGMRRNLKTFQSTLGVPESR